MSLLNELLAVTAVILAVIGLVGCIVPVIPGPPISFSALVVLHFTSYADYSTVFFIIMFLAAVAVTVLDYIFPVIGTKNFGGTKRGIWGASIGLLAGIFFPPLGLIIGPFVGALVGEMTGGMKMDEALMPSVGSLIGVVTGIVAKMIVSGLVLYYVAAGIFSGIISRLS